MTLREKLALDHTDTDYVSDDFAGGALGCPSDYGYADIPSFCNDNRCSTKCTSCWDREYVEIEDGNNTVKEENTMNNRISSYRTFAEVKRDINPLIDVVLSIEDLLMVTELNWTISYEPTTKSYSIFITKPEENEQE